MKTTGMWFPQSVAVMTGLVAGKVWAVEPDPRLVAAQIMVESGGRNDLIGDKHLPKAEWAYGPLQIRQCCVDDINQRFHTFYRATDCLGRRELSILIYKKYIGMYATQTRLGHKPTMEDMARIWNGGPTGWKRKSTLGYWRKVELVLRNVK